MKLTPRWYQREAVDSIYQFFSEFANDFSENPLLVCPTASGKSLIASVFIDEMLTHYPGIKIMCVTHVKELVEQNSIEFSGYSDHKHQLGIFQAGIGRRDTDKPVIFASIQSVYKCAHKFGKVDVILIDECHLVPNKSHGTYRQFLSDVRKYNPKCRIIGLSATPWRLNDGLLIEGEQRIFTQIIYEIQMKTLLAEGVLAPIVTPAVEKVDASGVKIDVKTGDFVKRDLELLMDKERITEAAINEILLFGEKRNSWLVFCTGVKHAQHVAEKLTEKGINCELLLGTTTKQDRKKIIDDFKNFRIKCIVSVDTITTGFNAKNADLGACLRPTQSSALWLQMCGRLMRTHETKTDALMLDFAGNIERFGEIDKIKGKPKKKPKAQAEKENKFYKICLECDFPNHPARLVCVNCNKAFPPAEERIDHYDYASRGNIISGFQPYQDLIVDDVRYSKHHKLNAPPSLRVDYYCQDKKFSEWICLEHTGYARIKAVKWWVGRSDVEPPTTIDVAMGMLIKLRKPVKIIVNFNAKYPEIIKYEYNFQ